MGLMKTLTKVAIGIAVAEGTRMVMNRRSGGSSLGRSGGASGIEKMVKDLIGGKSGSTSRSRADAPTGGLGGLGGLLGAGGIGGALGGMLGSTLGGGDAKAAEEELEAGLMLRVMIAAIKADGQLDDAEKARLMEAAGDAGQDEIAFINQELAAPSDINTLIRQIPRGMEEKAYTAALLAIDLDQRSEAEFLHGLAEGLGLSRPEVNTIHDTLKAPRIYD